MAGQEAHGEASERFYWQLPHNNTQIPSRAPDSPIPTALLLEDFRDKDQDSAEFQLARTPSNSNDPANLGFPGLNLHCDAKLASLDPEENTQTRSSFPALPSFRASAGHHTLGSSGDYRVKNMTATSPVCSGVSPSSSPRLPSPPPFTEVQIGPKSPLVADANQNPFGDTTRIDNDSTRRIRPGTKAADMDKGPPLVPLNEVCNSKDSLLACYHVGHSSTEPSITSSSQPNVTLRSGQSADCKLLRSTLPSRHKSICLPSIAVSPAIPLPASPRQ